MNYEELFKYYELLRFLKEFLRINHNYLKLYLKKIKKIRIIKKFKELCRKNC
jgi:hypothetical protein